MPVLDVVLALTSCIQLVCVHVFPWFRRSEISSCLGGLVRVAHRIGGFVFCALHLCTFRIVGVGP